MNDLWLIQISGKPFPMKYCLIHLPVIRQGINRLLVLSSDGRHGLSPVVLLHVSHWWCFRKVFLTMSWMALSPPARKLHGERPVSMKLTASSRMQDLSPSALSPRVYL